jgi:hypothetical protein
MDGELWPTVYRLIDEQRNLQPRRRKYCQFSDVRILEVFFWAAIHDRPVCWACRQLNWPAEQRWRTLPAASTMSQRLASLSLRLLIASVLDRLKAVGIVVVDLPESAGVGSSLVRILDSKPLPVGGHSKDRDARWGHAAAEAKARGYKMFCGWSADGVVPDAWTLGPMNRSDAEAGAELVPQLCGAAYVLGDALHDTNPLHEACGRCGMQLVAPRKRPRTGLGHCVHEPGRLRSIDMLEWPVERCGKASPFARELYAMRGDIERHYGNLTSFGGGLQPLPSWVRTPHRTALWIAAKLVINGVRKCRLKGLAA